MSATTSYGVVEYSRSVRPASARLHSSSTVISNRCGRARSTSVTPIRVSTSRSLTTILSTHDLSCRKEFLQFTEMEADQVRVHRAQFVEGIVARQHRAGVDAAGAARFNVVFHVADEHRFLPVEPVLVQDVMNLGRLVLDADIGFGDIGSDTEPR